MTGKHEVEVTERKRGTEGHGREERKAKTQTDARASFPRQVSLLRFCAVPGTTQSKQKKPNCTARDDRQPVSTELVDSNLAPRKPGTH